MPDKETTTTETVVSAPATTAPTVTETPKPEDTPVSVVEEEEDIDQENIEELTKDKSFKSLLMAVPKRILELIIKVIGGKGAVLAIGTYLFMYTEKIPLWAWLLLVVIFIGGRYADKLIDRLVPGGTF
jgi:hypothetical protein